MQTKFAAYQGMFSPDGKWIAYNADESGRDEVYVTAFPGLGGERQVSTTGGKLPLWRRDGKEIFFVGVDGRLRASAVRPVGATLEVDEPQTLPVSGSYVTGSLYEASADGQRFLVVAPPEQTTAEPLTLVQNWVAMLKK